MNAFYERLTVFGASIQAATKTTQQPLADFFTLIHPSFPVVSKTKSITPKLEFKDACPVTERRKIRQLLRSAFRRNQSV